MEPVERLPVVAVVCLAVVAVVFLTVVIVVCLAVLDDGVLDVVPAAVVVVASDGVVASTGPGEFTITKTEPHQEICWATLLTQQLCEICFLNLLENYQLISMLFII